jgi:alanine racemase
MDSVTANLGSDPDMGGLCGEPAVLIGAQGSQRIAAEEVAARLHSINYEVTCGLTARVERVHQRRDGTLWEIDPPPQRSSPRV